MPGEKRRRLGVLSDAQPRPSDCHSAVGRRPARAVGETHRRYTRRVNFREKWRGYLWQGRFASFVMDEPHLLAAARYVELNPVRAGLVASASEWPWSIARCHLSGRDNRLVQVGPMLAMIADWRGFLSTARRLKNRCAICGTTPEPATAWAARRSPSIWSRQPVAPSGRANQAARRDYPNDHKRFVSLDCHTRSPRITIQEGPISMETHCISPKRSGVAGRRIGVCFIALVLLLSMGGCVKETTESTIQTFSYELWVPLSVLLVGILATAAGWKLRDTSARFGWGLVVMGPCAVFLFAPSLLREQVIVDDTGLYTRSGIWGLTAVRDVKYEDLQLVRFTFRAGPQRPGGDAHAILLHLRAQERQACEGFHEQRRERGRRAALCRDAARTRRSGRGRDGGWH